MNHNTLKQAIGESGYADSESLRKSIGEDSMSKGLKSVGVNIHRATGSKGPTVAPQQGGRQYANPNVKSGSIRSSAPGHGEGRGSPHIKKR